jgi:HJR/Mrr/RecB family endonuclease
LFRERGYAVKAMGPGADIGVDFTIQKDNERVAVEVKKLSKQSRVSVETVRRLLSAVHVAGGSLGILVATSGYTAAALGLAAGTPILLLTLEEILAAKSNKDLLQLKHRSG